MKFTTTIIAGLAGLCAAAPTAIEKRTGQAALNDGDILNFALTLELLEAAFYKTGVATFSKEIFLQSGLNERNYNDFLIIAQDESTHVSFIQQALAGAGVKAVEECQYQFPVTDFNSFLTVAALLEGVGVSAYLGAAAAISDKKILTAAASILTVEARHNSFIQLVRGQKPFPAAFDTPLSPNEVFTLAATFIKSCPPSNPPLPFQAFPGLARGGDVNVRVQVNVEVIINTPGYTLVPPAGQTQIFAAFINVQGAQFVEASPVQGGFRATVPEGFSGQTYVVLTGCKDQVSDRTVAAGPLILSVE